MIPLCPFSWLHSRLVRVSSGSFLFSRSERMSKNVPFLRLPDNRRTNEMNSHYCLTLLSFIVKETLTNGSYKGVAFSKTSVEGGQFTRNEEYSKGKTTAVSN